MRYTLRQLEVFLAAARYENISRAAESLSMSQSAASAALRELEQQFEIQLLDRVGKRLQLNDLGKIMQAKAQSLMEQAQELEAALRQHSDVGDLKVGATLTIGNYLAVGIMARFMDQHPGVNVQLHVANTAEIASKVSHFELDIGLIEGELNDPQLEIEPWCDDELVVFCAPEHPLASQQTISDEDLIATPWILREAGSGTRQTFDRAVGSALPELQVLLELEHTEAIKRAVEANLGIACLSKVTLKEAFSRGSLMPLHTPHLNLRRRFYFILHKQKYRSAGIQNWLGLCREAAQ